MQRHAVDSDGFIIQVSSISRTLTIFAFLYIQKFSSQYDNEALRRVSKLRIEVAISLSSFSFQP